MRLLPTIKDSSDRESHTLLFVTLAVLPLVVKFTLAGFIVPVLGLVAPMSPTEFGLAFGTIMAVWLGREWIKK